MSGLGQLGVLLGGRPYMVCGTLDLVKSREAFSEQRSVHVEDRTVPENMFIEKPTKVLKHFTYGFKILLVYKKASLQ